MRYNKDLKAQFNEKSSVFVLNIEQIKHLTPQSFLNDEQKMELIKFFKESRLSYFQTFYIFLLIQSRTLNISYNKGIGIDYIDYIEKFRGIIQLMLYSCLDTEFESMVRKRATQIATNYWLREYGNVLERAMVRVMEICEPESSGLHYYHPTERESQRVNEITEGRYFGKEEFIDRTTKALVEMAKNRPESLGFGLYNKLKSYLGDLFLIICRGSGNPDRDIQEFANLWRKMSEDRMLETFGFSKSQIEEVLRILG